MNKSKSLSKTGNFDFILRRLFSKILIYGMALIFSVGVEAGEGQRDNTNRGGETPHMDRPNVSHKEGRQKFIDFDGDLVEGMNKSPYDSLNQVSEAQKRRRMVHLYRKRKGFPMEVQQTLKKMRYIQ